MILYFIKSKSRDLDVCRLCNRNSLASTLAKSNIFFRKRAKISGKFRGIVKATKRNAGVKSKRRRNKKAG